MSIFYKNYIAFVWDALCVQCKCNNTQTKQKKNNWKKNLKFSENGPLLSRTQPSWTMTT